MTTAILTYTNQESIQMLTYNAITCIHACAANSITIHSLSGNTQCSVSKTYIYSSASVV